MDAKFEDSLTESGAFEPWYRLSPNFESLSGDRAGQAPCGSEFKEGGLRTGHLRVRARRGGGP